MKNLLQELQNMPQLSPRAYTQKAKADFYNKNLEIIKKAILSLAGEIEFLIEKSRKISSPEKKKTSVKK